MFFRACREYCRRTGVFGILMVIVVATVGIGVVSDEITNYRWRHLSSGDHLRLAYSACGFRDLSGMTGHCASPAEALRQLAAIEPKQKEYLQASSLRLRVGAQMSEEDETRRERAYYRF
jgi:hypothetical protein